MATLGHHTCFTNESVLLIESSPCFTNESSPCFTTCRIGLKTAQKSNKTAFRLHSTGADLFENVTFAVATRPRFLNVVERKRSATRRCVNTNAVTFWYHL